MANDCVIVSGALLAFVSVLLILILVPLHFSYVERNNYALKRNTVTNDVFRDEVYENGRYAWGVSYGAVEFPAHKLRIDFTGRNALSVFTESGQVLIVEFVFFPRIIKKSVPALYDAFGAAHFQRIISIARAELRNAAPSLILENYTANRKQVASVFYNKIASVLEDRAFVKLDEGSFFLQGIFLPNITLTQKIAIFNVTQSIVTQNFVKTANITRLQTQLNVTEIDNQAELIRSNATAESKRQVTEAEARYFSSVQGQIGAGLADMAARLGVTQDNTSALLIKFNQLLDRSSPATVLSGLKSALLQNT